MSKKITMADIASELDISVNAVSLALNGKKGVSETTRSKVFNVAEKLGYFTDKPKYIQAVKNKTICLITRRRYFSDPSFYSKMILGIQEQAALEGYSILVELLDVDDSVLLFKEPEDIPKSIKEKLVSGAVIMGAVSDEYLEKIYQTGIPIVLVDHKSSKFNVDSVMSANEDGTYQLTQYLLNQGYREIGFFGDFDYSVSIKERYLGVLKALYEFFDDKSYILTQKRLNKYSVLHDLEFNIIDKNYDVIWHKLKQIEKLPEVFICSNDYAASVLIDVLRRHSIHIPGEVAVAGFDNSLPAVQHNKLITTVNVSKKALGREAIRRLAWKIKNPQAMSTRISIQTELVIRKTTK